LNLTAAVAGFPFAETVFVEIFDNSVCDFIQAFIRFGQINQTGSLFLGLLFC